ncbi:hypothetical protein SAMN05421810_10277 [Amycolatopsis arida]|uniref:Phospholipase A2 n=1 Tax=Amycolatopsis arida TaxID=587909 RepID=A0A1I5NYE7_9PSEU|nr:phospholipase [Amycolatopsis arida]TDX98286.1 hypothetical protein CLV69_10177 [Amycolatopsis arida]SFP26819.1 hypothetical protein SAMN05421810_10277 [Amycolatopsis arida]
MNRPPLPPRRPLWTSAWLLLLVLAVIGFGFVASRPAPSPRVPLDGDVAQAEQAVRALLTPGPRTTALDLLPADFTEVTGVRPGREPARDGTVRAVHADGGCSAPWGDDDTRWDYAVPCRSHDLGYDLLRYAAAKGTPLAPELREALDDRLSADMHATCGLNPRGSPDLCRAVASLYSAGLVVNSWHQRWGPPVGQPIAPMLCGLAMIGFLLTFRLRGWLHVRRQTPRRAPHPRPAPRPVSRWALLGVGGIVVLMLGESVVALARWAGAGEATLWPLTWLAQLGFVFFFAGGHANAAGWRAEVRAGGGYREYLAHRASWLLRPALVFAVVAFAVPVALELLGIPAGTTAAAMRIALHPLWLLGMYLLTVALTPVMLALHRRARWPTLLGTLGVVAGAELVGGTPAARYVGALGLALLAQQLAFAHADGRLPRRLLVPLGGAAAAGLAALAWSGGVPPLLLGTPGAAPVFAAPAGAVLLLGLTQLGALALLARPLAGLAHRPGATRAVAFALRAPMSLYLGFLTAMLLLIAVVYFPDRLGHGVAWLFQPRSVVALALLAGPAALVFWWFERHGVGHSGPRPVAPGAGRLGAPLSRAAAGLGIGYAMVGVFGLALTSLGADPEPSVLLGLSLDPIQSLLHLLLGVSLLQTVRTGASAAPVTWVLTALACVPPVLAATAGPAVDPLGLAVHGATALFAAAAVLATVLGARSAPMPTPATVPARTGG